MERLDLTLVHLAGTGPWPARRADAAPVGRHPITRIVLADAHPVYRRLLRGFLEGALALEVVAEAGEAEAVLDRVAEFRPDAVLIDVSTPRVGGLETTHRIAVRHPDVRVVALSLYEDRQFAQAVLDAGASAFVTKDDTVDRLPSVLRELSASCV